MRDKRETSQEKVTAASTIIIGNDLSNPDPVSYFFIQFLMYNNTIMLVQFIVC